ncbi:MAG: protein kinase [Byssovorax sp.]
MVDPKDIGTSNTVSVGGPSSGEAGSAPPARLADRYELLGLLGMGGMGAVYRARDTKLDEVVALKMLRAEFNDNAPMLARFHTEVRLARRVTHPNVARTFDLGEHGRSKFITMELVDGPSLAAILAGRGALPPAEAVEIACAICAGMSAAHAAGVVHRDLKPDNVLIAKDGRVVVTDFGIAGQHLGLEGGRSHEGIVGTPAYMAPEQIEAGAPIDLRADIYALGAVLFEMLAGERAWPGDSLMQVLSARLRGPVPDPRRRRAGLPEALAGVVMRCMATRPDDRFASGTEVAAELRGALASAPTVEMPTPAPGAMREPRLPAPTDRTLAVIPLRNLGPPEDAYLAEGVTDDLIDTLSMTPRLRVRPRSVVARLRSPGASADEIGRELGVQVIVDGSLQRVGPLVRFSARLISATDGFQIWARRFQAPMSDLLGLCDDAARAIATALTTELPGAERHAHADSEATDLYLRAKHELRQRWHSSATHAVELFEAALARAPFEPRILAGSAIALTRLLFMGEGEREAVVARAREVAERAVVAAPELGDTWAALASFRLNVDDPLGAARALREGSTRAPNAALLQDALGRLLLEVGATEEAIVRLNVALELDRTLVAGRTELARGLALLGEWDRSDALLADPILDVSPIPRDAIRARIALWHRVPAQLASIPPDSYIRVYHEALAEGRLRDDQRAFLRQRAQATKGRMRPLFLQRNTELYAFDGDIAAALDSAEAAVEAELIDLLWIDRCPTLEPLRAEPRWAALRAVVEARAAQIIQVLRGAPPAERHRASGRDLGLHRHSPTLLRVSALVIDVRYACPSAGSPTSASARRSRGSAKRPSASKCARAWASVAGSARSFAVATSTCSSSGVITSTRIIITRTVSSGGGVIVSGIAASVHTWGIR